MTYLPIHYHGDYIISPIVFILSENVAMYDNMPYGLSLAKIGNSKWMLEHENDVHLYLFWILQTWTDSFKIWYAG